MNISKENIDALNAVLTMEFEKADYEPKVEKALKDYAKKAAIKGFRPGHAPVAMVKKFYGKSILVDQVNNLVGEQLSLYIRENNLNLLGEPLPNEGQEPIDFDKEVDKLVFKFDLGLAPEINVTVDKSIKVPAYTITVDDAAIDEQVKNICGRYGNHQPVEAATAESMLKGELSVAGEVKNEKCVVSVSVVKDEAEKAKFVGKKVGDVVSFDVRKAFSDDTEISYIVGCTKDEAAAVNGVVADLKITDVTEYKEAEVGKDLFDKVFPGQEVADETAFRTKVSEALAQGNAISQDYRFSIDARKALQAVAGEVALPEAFLKRWLTAINRDNDKFTPEMLDKEFPSFVEDLKWQVVKNAIMRKNDLKLDYNDVLEFAKKQTRAQFMQYGITNITDEQLAGYAANLLKTDEQRSRMQDGAAEDKVVAFVRDNAEVEAKTISSADFGKLFEDEK